ncbi:MAG TPA: hypothetical protein VFC78_06055 [Tepidisphaeraceae bacterium]|nr:hypothetical protein [Tepidisphaeraceae bacterium]
MMAHSMGNVVASEALRIESVAPNPQKLVKTYVASQAASAAEAYDATVPQLQGPLSPMGKPGPARSIAGLATPDYYAIDPTTQKPYFSGIGAAATSIVNYYNPLDLILSQYPLIQWGKDLIIPSPNGDGFHYNGTLTPPFYADSLGKISLTWGKDNYQIMAQILQVRTGALGATNMPNGAGKVFSTQVNLATTPGINFGIDPGDHSGEFRSDEAIRHGYWDQLLKTFGLAP